MKAKQWGKFAEQQRNQGEDTTPHPTMSIRQVIKESGEIRIEQLIEHRTNQGMVVNTEWVEIPVIIKG